MQISDARTPEEARDDIVALLRDIIARREASQARLANGKSRAAKHNAGQLPPAIEAQLPRLGQAKKEA